uniref:Uncharacterized protein n=1 Tax=Oryza glumipatula TaxID=40148 RepID=A0A0E0B014_9ORYZ
MMPISKIAAPLDGVLGGVNIPSTKATGRTASSRRRRAPRLGVSSPLLSPPLSLGLLAETKLPNETRQPPPLAPLPRVARARRAAIYHLLVVDVGASETAPPAPPSRSAPTGGTRAARRNLPPRRRRRRCERDRAARASISLQQPRLRRASSRQGQVLICFAPLA